MKFSFKNIEIVLAAFATSLLHFTAAFDHVLFPDGADPLFILNGVGYLGLLGLYFLPIPFLQQKRHLTRRVLMGYTILTIVAWLVIWVGFSVIRDGIPFFSRDSWYGVPAKIAELLLLVLLWTDKD
jgi:hypothetical protein